MTSTPFKLKKHKDDITPDESEEVIQRLLDEVRMLKGVLLEIRYEVNCAEADFERMSVIGCIKKLAKDRREAQVEVRKLNKELDKLVRSSK
jgi:hypothetical protein